MHSTPNAGAHALCVMLLAVLLPHSAMAFEAVSETGLEVHLETLERGRQLFHTDGVAPTFERNAAIAALPGQWTMRWNRLTQTPHRAYGPGIAVATAASSMPALDQVSRDFVDTHPGLFALTSSDLVLTRRSEVRGLSALLYQQTYHGIPVESARVDLFYAGGRLVMFGSDAHPDITLDPSPAVDAESAIRAANAGMPATEITPDGAPVLRILPVPTVLDGRDDLSIVHHLAYRMVLSTSEPRGRWVTWVDAHTGDLLWRRNDLRYLEIEGQVEGDVQDYGYCDGVAPASLEDLTVQVTGAGSTNSGAGGGFSIFVPDSSSRTVTASLAGPHVEVDNQGGPDAAFSTAATPGSPVTIDWTDANSQQDERDVFFHTNRVYDFVRAIDPLSAFGILDGPLTANVSLGATCNAFWDGFSINFYAAGDGCANTGELGDVVYHEWGHGLTQVIYAPQVPGGDLHEGNSDILSTHMTGSSIIGKGFTEGVCGAGIRDCQNDLRYPEDVVGHEGHAAGRVICGFDWDVLTGLQAINPAIYQSHADSLWHYSRALTAPMSQPDQVLAYFLLDDDDFDLSNGTPHYDALCPAADRHGFDPPGPAAGALVVPVTHDDLRSTTSDAAPYTVSATITSSAGNVDVAQTKLVYRVGAGAPIEVPMSAAGGSNYAGAIPPQAVGSRVAYAIITGDDAGNDGSYPPNRCDPSVPGGERVFHVASTLVELEDAAHGWTVGAPGDDATTGVWERVDPNGTAAQPENDRTPSAGTMAFITGQCAPGCGLGDNDVDGGKTTLVSALYDLSSFESASVLYHRWFTNNTGASPNSDAWIVDASNDGGASWVNVESTTESDPSWREVRVDLSALFGAAPNLVRFRFIAADEGEGSLVEAGVDDFMIFAGVEPVSVADVAPAPTVAFRLGGAVPNPFNPSTTITFELAQRAPVRVAIYDVRGRMVGELAADVFEAGSHELNWDGRSRTGARASSGVYYVRMTAPGFADTQKLVLLK